MPYYKKGYKKKRYYKKKRMPISSYALKTAKKALRKVNIMNKATELKFVDLSFSRITDMPATGFLTILNTVPIGTGDNNRIGDKIFCKSVQIRFELNRGNQDSIIRMIVIRDKANTVLNSDVLEYSGNDDAFVPLNPYRRDTKYDYKVLMDKRFIVSNVERNIYFKSYNIKLNCLTQFATASNIIEHNAIKILFFTDAFGAVTWDPTIYFMSRLYFTDP